MAIRHRPNPDDAAAYWAIRLDAEDLGEQEQRELDAWLAEDERRAGALLRAEAALAYLDRGRALDLAVESDEDERPHRMHRKLAIAATAAAAVVGLTMIGAWGLTPPEQTSATFQTAIGEVRRVPLDDGSAASLNTNSKIAVDFGSSLREVRMESGEAWFQVAHDRDRPFQVEAGDLRVKAVGTAFSVRMLDDGGSAEVVVTEGVVEAWVDGNEGSRRRITAGYRDVLDAATPARKPTLAKVDVDWALAWRTGDLVLNGESLGYAAAELNRYNSRKLVIRGEDLKRESLVGYFRTNQPEQFGKSAAALLDAKVSITGNTIEISR